MAAAAPVLECGDLRKQYGDLVAVDGVGFTIDERETYGLLGPNGAGKTTCVSIISGLLERDGGRVILGGAELTTASVALRASIGYVPQELAIYPDLTGRENLVFFARLYGLQRDEASARVDEVLDVIGLSERGKDLAKEYSGGMKRRLNIGIGLLHRPKLLILDEPTVGVDPQSRNAILQSVEELSGSGMAVLYTTHYMEEAERLCNRVGIIDAGKLCAEGTRRELIALVGEQDRVSLSLMGDIDSARDALLGVERVQQVIVHEEGLDAIVEEARTVLPAMLQALAAAGVVVRTVEVKEPNLEAVFLHLTGRALRD